MTRPHINQFKYFHHLFAFAVALWISFLGLRTFEVIASVESNTVSAHFLSFIAGFWADLFLVVLLVPAMGLLSFLISLFSYRIMEVTTAILGGLTVLFSCLLSFHTIQTKTLLHRFDVTHSGQEWEILSTILGQLRSFPNLVFLALLLTGFIVAYFKISGLNNAKTLVLCVLGIFAFGILPPVQTWFKLQPDVRPIAANKPQYFFKERHSQATFEEEPWKISIFNSTTEEPVKETATKETSSSEKPATTHAKKQQGSVQQAAIAYPGYGQTEEAQKPDLKGFEVVLTQKERNYLYEASLASLSSDDLFYKAKSLAYRGQFFEAESIVKYLITRQGTNADYRLIYGLILSWQRKFNTAEEQLYVGIHLAPHYTELYLALADVHRWKEDKTKAIHILDSATTLVDHPERLYAKKETLEP